MAKLPAEELERLQSASLFVCDFNPPPRARVRNVLLIAKPTSVNGNFIQGHESIVGSPEKWTNTDAPFLKLFHFDHRWFVESGNPITGFDDADFHTTWSCPCQAVEDVLQFFFGDSSRMQAKEREMNKRR